ncbi:MAG: amidophosphoribosyltransferase [Clostridia bacterium]|nr:amidophosphoribosyltransferase [Clostridia bacterium]
MSERINEECGVFGVYSKESKDQLAYMIDVGLSALQHRGEESCGIAINRDGLISYRKDLGLVSKVFPKHEIEALPEGKMGIGHVRYSTTGEARKENAQPMVIRHKKGNLAVVHNGNLINAYDLRAELEENGAIFTTTTDTEVICHVIVQERLKAKSIEEAVQNTMKRLKGSYSLLIMTSTKLLAARDPQGFKPLCMGKTENRIVFASESCALDITGAELVRDVKPGEIITVTNNEIKSIETSKDEPKGLCVFEYIYFARPDSVIDGISVHKFREDVGRCLAKQAPVEADIVAGVPDSGLDAALGYAKESGIHYDMAFTKSKYIGRTFIQNAQETRNELVGLKLNPIKVAVEGKRIILIDDSIVRGTTIRKIIAVLRKAGAKEVHLRIASPAFIDACYFGTDIDSKENLVTYNRTIDDIRKMVNADSLEYLNIDSLKEITKECNISNLCNGCFTGKYPIEVPKEIKKNTFEEIEL